MDYFAAGMRILSRWRRRDGWWGCRSSAWRRFFCFLLFRSIFPGFSRTDAYSLEATSHPTCI